MSGKPSVKMSPLPALSEMAVHSTPPRGRSLLVVARPSPKLSNKPGELPGWAPAQKQAPPAFAQER